MKIEIIFRGQKIKIDKQNIDVMKINKNGYYFLFWKNGNPHCSDLIKW